MSNIPKIRFKGFTEEWEQRKCKAVAPLQRGFDLPISQMVEGEYPVVMSNGIGGYHNEYKVKGPGVITGRSGTIGKIQYIESDYWPHNTALWVTDFKNNYPQFIFYLYMNLDLSRFGTGSGVPTLNRNDVHDALVYVPNLDEQKKLAVYFNSIDHLITLHQRKYDEITELKKYMLKKMFPAKGKNTPEIRFTGFTEDWEQRKLGEIIEKLTGGTSIAPDDYVESGYRTIPKGAINNSGIADMSGCKNVSEEFFVKNISSKTSTGELVTSLRDLVPTAPNMGRIVRICGDSEEFLMPQGVYSIVVKNNISEDFLITYSNSSEYRKIIMAEKNGSTQVHIRNGEFLNIDIPLPSYEEQKKVGSYFAAIDHLLTLHQQKLDELTELKKYMLQNMFPKKEG